MNRPDRHKLTDRNNSMVVTGGKGAWGASKEERGLKCMVTKGDLTLGAGHTRQYSGDGAEINYT